MVHMKARSEKIAASRRVLMPLNGVWLASPTSMTAQITRGTSFTYRGHGSHPSARRRTILLNATGTAIDQAERKDFANGFPRSYVARRE